MRFITIGLIIVAIIILCYYYIGADGTSIDDTNDELREHASNKRTCVSGPWWYKGWSGIGGGNNMIGPFIGCATVNHDTPWCPVSVTTESDGKQVYTSGGNWMYCKDIE